MAPAGQGQQAFIAGVCLDGLAEGGTDVGRHPLQHLERILVAGGSQFQQNVGLALAAGGGNGLRRAL